MSNHLRYLGFHQFGGLDLASSPDKTDGAIDLCNVDLDRPDVVRTRRAWVPRGPEFDGPIQSFHHGWVEKSGDRGPVSLYQVAAASGVWIGPLYGTPPMGIESGELVSGTQGGSAIYDLSITDGEVFVALPDGQPPFTPSNLFIRTGLEGTPSWRGYRLQVVLGGQIWAIDRIGSSDGSGSRYLSPAGTQTVSAGGTIALRAVGNVLQGWYKPSAGSWSKVLEVTDATGGFVSGHIGVGVGGTGSSVAFDNFGGGAAAGDQAPVTSVLDDFNRSDESPLGGSFTLVAYRSWEETEATKSVAVSTYSDAAQFSTPAGSVILVTEETETSTNIGINVVEADSNTPYVAITPMPYSGGPPDAPSLDWVRHIGVQQPDNRVVVAGVGSGSSFESRVCFSEPDDYTNWPSRNENDLSPGDGEVFTGIVGHQGQTWVLKESKAFIFYGNSATRTGAPVFNYRTIELGTRCVPRDRVGAPSLGAGVVSGENGVYFVGVDGIYICDGRESAKVSGPLDGLVEGTWEGVNPVPMPVEEALRAGLHYANRRLYVNLGSRVLVWDESERYWLAWLPPLAGTDPDSAAIASWIGATDRVAADPMLALSNHPDGHQPWGLANRAERGATTDGSAPIPAWYQSGFNNFGSDYIDRLEMTRVWAAGQIDLAVCKDFEPSAAGQAASLGDPATSYLEAPRETVARLAMSGVLFSHRVSGNAPWALHRLVHAISSQEAPGSK